MRLLFLLIWRNNFTLFFILLEVLCFYLVARNNRFQQASVLNATNQMVTTTMEGVNYVRDYIHLRENNIALSQENAMLRSRLQDTRYSTERSNTFINDSSYFQQYTYITAKVVNNSIHHRNNYITLNKGTLQGIRPEMGVITTNGIAGIVNQVSAHYCTVMSLLHSKTNLSAMIRRNGFFGSLKWEGDDPTVAYLYEIDKTVPVKAGDTVQTTSFSSIFPAGIPIGKVVSTKVEPGSPFHKIKVRLFTNFGNLSHVYIVNNLLKKEQQVLEAGNTGKEDGK